MEATAITTSTLRNNKCNNALRVLLLISLTKFALTPRDHRSLALCTVTQHLVRPARLPCMHLHTFRKGPEGQSKRYNCIATVLLPLFPSPITRMMYTFTQSLAIATALLSTASALPKLETGLQLEQRAALVPTNVGLYVCADANWQGNCQHLLQNPGICREHNNSRLTFSMRY